MTLLLPQQTVSFRMAELMQTMGFIQGCTFAAHLRNNCHKEDRYRVLPVGSPGVTHEGYGPPPSKGCLDGYSAYNVHELLIMVGSGTNAESLLLNMIQLKSGNGDKRFSFTKLMNDPDFIAQCLIDIERTSNLPLKEANNRLKEYYDAATKH